MKQSQMNKAIVLTTLIFFFGKLSTAQQDALLWKIDGPEIHTSYLFGTIHVLPKADFELKPKVEKAINASEQLVLEVDLSDPNIAMEMMQKASMANGNTIDNLLSASDYSLLDSLLQAGMGMSLVVLNTMKPMVISSFLIRNMIEGEPVSFETELMALASPRQIPIAGLETIGEQMAIFDSISYESQVEDLLEMVHQEAEMKAYYYDLVALYKAEKVASLHDETVSFIDDLAELEHVLYTRNRAWIPKIVGFVQAKPSFIGVGAAHLGGPQGVIALLQEAGYTVSPVE